MNTPNSWTGPVGRLMAGPFLRLRDAVADLVRRLRDRIAEAAGEALSVLIRILLDNPIPPSCPPIPPRSRWGENTWEEDPNRDPFWDEPVNEFRNEDDPPAEPAKAPTTPSRWRQALAVTVETILCWLRHQPGRYPGLTALVVATAAGTAAYAGAPLVSALVALAGSSLSLVTLVDQLAADAGKLAHAVNR